MSEQKTENLPPPPLEKSRNIYIKPFPKTTLVREVIKEGPAHNGPYRGAIDFPMLLGTPVLAPLEGDVVRVVDGNDKYGPSEKFVRDLNYITIYHANGEYSEVAHLAKDSSMVKIGDKVTAGQQIAETGNSGWMTEPHLHLLIFKMTNDENGFKGLEPQFRRESILTKLHLKRL